MSTSRIEIAPDHGPDGERSNVLRTPETAEQQKRVAEALNRIAESDSADTVVDAMGLKTHLDDRNNPVRTFLTNSNAAKVRLFLEASFKKAQDKLQKDGDVQGLLTLKNTQAEVFAALDTPSTEVIERTNDQRSAA